jgi:hypothetical protein
MAINLNLSDRYLASRFVSLLPCTLALRSVIDEFLGKMEPTQQEIDTYGVEIDHAQLELTTKSEDPAKEFEVDPVVVRAMRSYNARMDTPDFAKNESVQKIIATFKKFLPQE